MAFSHFSIHFGIPSKSIDRSREIREEVHYCLCAMHMALPIHSVRTQGRDIVVQRTVLSQRHGPFLPRAILRRSVTPCSQHLTSSCLLYVGHCHRGWTFSLRLKASIEEGCKSHVLFFHPNAMYLQCPKSSFFVSFPVRSYASKCRRYGHGR